ncbi:hypothetical protein SBRCBS47491_008588 [Sporothrix bragantina]|uniref:Cytochrome P450 n=1 Tax=Sporothrix bragantina TaxID=671064 RepID=A0ABP0CN23_9PEZI
MFGFYLAGAAGALIFINLILHPLYLYLADRHALRRYPSVSIAAFTNAWGVLHQYFHTRTEAVHAAHQKYGPVVRIGPTNVSYATLQAIRDIYGHGTPACKDDFYGAQVSTHVNISDAQDKGVHSTRRRRFAAALAQSNVMQMEDNMCVHLLRLMKHLDDHADNATVVDMKRAMLHTTYGFASVLLYAQDPNLIGKNSTVTTAETPDGRLYQADMYQSMIDASRMSTSAGWAPRSMRLLKFLTQWHPGWSQGSGFRDVTIHFLRNRLRMDAERVHQGLPPLDDDLASTMLYDKKSGNALGLELGELVTESANMFNAAGENTEIALTNAVWLLARNPAAASKLRSELDAALGAMDGIEDEDDKNQPRLPRFDDVKDLPYLRACIDETMRLRPSIEGGLARVTPAQGMYVNGDWLPGGVTVSVSTHTMHRDATVFGERPEDFVPERWLSEDPKTSAMMQRGFLAFSQGGRGCIGRNIAYFEMVLILGLLFSRYDFSLPTPDWVLALEENFSAHTKALPIRVTRRACKTNAGDA